MAFERLRLGCIGLVAGSGMMVLFAARPARGAPGGSGAESECMSAYNHAKELSEAGSFREARDALVSCTKPSCSKALRQQCEVEYNRLDSQIPTIVPHFTDKSGARRADVQVQVDGQPLTSRLDEQPLPVNPGIHEFTFKTADGETVSTKVMILENDRLRPIDVTLAPPQTAPASAGAPAAYPPSPAAPSPAASPPAASTTSPTEASSSQSSGGSPKEQGPATAIPEEPEPPLPSGPPALPFVLGGAGLAVAGTGAVLLGVGKQNVLDFAVDGLAIGAGALVGAFWLLARPHPAEKKPAPRAAYTVDVHPAVGGAVAAVAGRF